MKKSEFFTEKQSAIKVEMIDTIKSVLPKDGSKIELNKDEYFLEVGGNIDCEFHDNLRFLYLTNNTVLASLYSEPENEIELDQLHESSLIQIIDYLERHGYL